MVLYKNYKTKYYKMEIPSLFNICKNFISSALEKEEVWNKVTSYKDKFLLECAKFQANFNERQEFLLRLHQPSNYVDLQSYSEEEEEEEEEEYNDRIFDEYEDDFGVVDNEFDDFVYDDYGFYE
jgi:hypothetical protein